MSILAFAERVLPRASDLWVQASLEQRQRLQQLFFPNGVVFDGNRFVRTGVSTHAFKYLTPDLPAENNLASLSIPSRNQIAGFLDWCASFESRHGSQLDRHRDGRNPAHRSFPPDDHDAEGVSGALTVLQRRGRVPLPQGGCLALCRQRARPEGRGRTARHSRLPAP